MAGSEKTGYSNSSIRLLENAYYAITPTSTTTMQNLDNYVKLQQLGAIPVVIDYFSVAGIDVHLIAGSLVNLVKDSDSEDELTDLTGCWWF